MATTITKTIKPSGGDYTSQVAYEAGRQADLVTADTIEQAECYAMEDTSPVTYDGWTTGPNNYIRIYTPASERHDGKLNLNKYVLKNTNNSVYTTMLTCNELFTRIEGIQIYNSVSIDPAGAGLLVFNGADAWATSLYIDSCIFQCSSAATNMAGVKIGFDPTNSHKIFNSMMVNCGYGCSHYAGNTYFANCTFANNAYDLVQNSDVRQGFYLYNNIFYGTRTAIKDSYTVILGTNYNATDKSSFGWTAGSNDRVSQTFSFVDSANRDYHLTASDTGAKDYGMTNPLSGLYSTDIDGQTRSGTWDIGADEYVAAATGNPWYYYAQN